MEDMFPVATPFVIVSGVVKTVVNLCINKVCNGTPYVSQKDSAPSHKDIVG